MGGTESQELTVFKLWPWPVTLTFKVQTSNMRATHRLVELNISTKEYANWSRDKKVMGRNRISEFSNFDLEQWPWPLRYRLLICARHTVSWNWTLVPKNMQIGQGIRKLWAGRESRFSNFDLEQWPWPLRYRLLICARHIVSWSWTLVPKNMQIGQGIRKLWAGRESRTDFGRTDGRTDGRTEGRKDGKGRTDGRTRAIPV